jgi:hypothetical protein
MSWAACLRIKGEHSLRRHGENDGPLHLLGDHTVNGDGSRGSFQPAIFRGRLTRRLELAEGRMTTIAACSTCGTEPLVSLHLRVLR